MTALANVPDPIAAVAAMKETVYLHDYTVPEDVRLRDTDPRTVVLKELSFEEELQGNRISAASGNPYQKVAMALVEVDGRQLSWAKREGELALAAMSPKVRDLISTEYKRLHTSNDDEDARFRATHKLRL
jgi:fumarate hydratase class II